MNCSNSEETLALFVEGDLSDGEGTRIRRHLSGCSKCQNSYERLRNSQALLKSRLSSTTTESISRQTLAEVRHAVLSQIQQTEDSLNWRLRIERSLWLGCRKTGFAFAGLAAMALVAVIVLLQGYRPTHAAGPVAMFDSANMLTRPEGYRDWAFIGSSLGKHSGVPQSFENVYVNRSSYKDYVQSGRFPEGTTLVLELVKPESSTLGGSRISFGSTLTSLHVSVKDGARFEGGWGFFDFTGENGTLPAKTQALPESSGCRSCHKTCAETDQVFTQFYPLLKSTRA